MKGTDIKVGMMVGLKEMGRSNRLIGTGKVVETGVETKGYSWQKSRKDCTRVHRFNKDGKPANKESYDSETKKFYETDEPWIMQVRNAQIISVEEYDAAVDAKRAWLAELDRRQKAIADARERTAEPFVKAGIPVEEIVIGASYNHKDDDVEVKYVQISGEGIGLLTKLVSFATEDAPTS